MCVIVDIQATTCVSVIVDIQATTCVCYSRHSGHYVMCQATVSSRH